MAKLGGEVAEGTMVSEKICRAWMDVKAAFTGKDRKAILESCEFGEDAAVKAYRYTLPTTKPISTLIGFLFF